MVHISSCNGGNVNHYPRMNECTIIVATTVLFVAHKLEFLCTVKQWKRNAHFISLLLNFHTQFQERANCVWKPVQ